MFLIPTVIRVFCVAVVLVLVCSICFSQPADDPSRKAKPDLTGVWLLKRVQSVENDRAEDKITDYVLTIIHKEPEIKMIVQFKRGGRDHLFQTIYYTDGRPELNPSFSDPQPFTGWRGKKLVRVTTSGPPGSIGTGQEARVTVEWELSDDGVTLTRTTSIAGVFGGKVTSIFKRST